MKTLLEIGKKLKTKRRLAKIPRSTTKPLKLNHNIALVGTTCRNPFVASVIVQTHRFCWIPVCALKLAWCKLAKERTVLKLDPPPRASLNHMFVDLKMVRVVNVWAFPEQYICPAIEPPSMNVWSGSWGRRLLHIPRRIPRECGMGALATEHKLLSSGAL